MARGGAADRPRRGARAAVQEKLILVEAGDTRLWVDERGGGDIPLFVLHGGPGLDHTMFGDALDQLGDVARLLLVDQRAQGRSDRDAPPETWTLEQMARDVDALAASLGLERYAVLGHSFGAMVALQHAVDFSPAATIVSSGVPSARYLAHIGEALASFEPEDLREQVASSWAREAEARTEDDVRALLRDQLPWHFADPRDPRIAAFDMSTARFAPDVLRAAAVSDYGAIEVEARLGEVRHPVLVLVGRHDRTCRIDAAEAIAGGIPGARLVVLEHSGHMGFIEEQDAYLRAVREFLAASL